MSRTDVHAPYWVKQLDPAWRDHFQEVHHHQDGVCTLQDYFESLRRNGRSWGDCFIQPVSRGRNIHCGCWMCSEGYSRSLRRRTERHQIKQALRSGQWEDPTPQVRERYWISNRPSTWVGYQRQKALTETEE